MCVFLLLYPHGRSGFLKFKTLILLHFIEYVIADKYKPIELPGTAMEI